MSNFASRNLTHGETNALVKLTGGEDKVRRILAGELKIQLLSAVRMQGTVFRLFGSTVRGGKSGNHYEVEARDVDFDEWNQQGLTMGERIFIAGGTVPSGKEPMTYYIQHPEERVAGHFFTILKDHGRWGIFLPAHPETGKYAPLDSILKTLIWYRRDGEQPVIENDDPGTFYYRIMVRDGVEIDAMERVKI